MSRLRGSWLLEVARRRALGLRAVVVRARLEGGESMTAHCTCESRKRGKGRNTCKTCGRPIDLMASLVDSLRSVPVPPEFDEEILEQNRDLADWDV